MVKAAGSEDLAPLLVSTMDFVAFMSIFLERNSSSLVVCLVSLYYFNMLLETGISPLSAHFIFLRTVQS